MYTQVSVTPEASEEADGDHPPCTGTESEGSRSGSDEDMNEDLGVYHDSLGYEKRFELRQCKNMGKGI